MSEQKKISVGQAIDQIVQALEQFEVHQQNTILGTVRTLLKIPTEPTSGAAPAPLQSATPTAPVVVPKAPAGESVEHGVDIKTLKFQKSPSSAREMACLVAYYLAELAPDSEQRKSVTAAEIEKYFKQAGYKLPTALDQVLPDSKRGGYFDSVARGEYRLNRVGHNLVVHNLPKQKAG